MILHQGILTLGFDFVSIIRYSYRHFTLIQRRPSYLPFTPPRCTIGFDMTVVTCGVVRAPEGRNLLCLPNAEHIPFAIFHRSLPRLSMRRIRQLRRRAAAAVAQHNLHANQGQNIRARKCQRQRQLVIIHHPPGGGGGSWAAGRPQQHALEDRILQHLFQQVHIGGGPRVPRAQEVRAWKATRVEAHAIHQGGQWFSTPALGREAPCPAGVVMLLLERAPKAAARVGRARPAAPATPRIGMVRTRT